MNWWVRVHMLQPWAHVCYEYVVTGSQYLNASSPNFICVDIAMIAWEYRNPLPRGGCGTCFEMACFLMQTRPSLSSRGQVVSCRFQYGSPMTETRAPSGGVDAGLSK